MEIPAKCMPQTTMIALYKMMYDIDKILNKYSINYFVDGGTLLGAVRHKGLIPWDDDLDIGIFSKDYNRLISILKDVEQYGYNYSTEGSIIKIYIKNLWIKDNKNNIWGTPTLDIFIWKEKDDKIILKDINNRKKWKNCWYYKNEMFPLKKYKFYNFNITGANNGKPYLDRFYPDWENKFIAETRDINNPQKKDYKNSKTKIVEKLNDSSSFLSKKIREKIKKDINFYLLCFNDNVFSKDDKLKTLKILIDSFKNEDLPRSIDEIKNFEFDKYYDSDCSTDTEDEISDNEEKDNKLEKIQEDNDDDYNYDELEGL